MRKFLNLFSQHPNSVDQTYCQHFWFAFKLGWLMFGLAVICFIHAVFPFCCTKTTSSTIKKLNKILGVRNGNIRRNDEL